MPTKRLTRDEKRAEIREDLLDAATELFAERGYWGVSIDEIAERAGVTKGAVYSNFANKEELLLEVAWRQRIDVDPALFADPSVPLAELFRTVGKEIARLASSEEQRKLVPRELEIATLAQNNEKIREIVVGSQRLQRQNLASFLTTRAAEQGVELPLPAEELAAIYLAVQRGLSQQRYLDPDSIPPQYFVDALALPFASMVQKRAGRKPRGRP